MEEAGACPPEDCGGVGGYMRLLSIIEDPAHEEYDGTLEWLEGMSVFFSSPSFSPALFDLNAINYRQGLYWRWSRRRYLFLTE